MILGEESAQDLFRSAIRIDISGIDEVAAGPLEQRKLLACFVFVCVTTSGHRA